MMRWFFLGSRVWRRPALAPTLTSAPFQGEAPFPDQVGRLEWAITWLDDDEGFLNSYCNTIPTPEGGTHEAGMRSALTKGLRQLQAGERDSLTLEVRTLAARSPGPRWVELRAWPRDTAAGGESGKMGSGVGHGRSIIARVK